jgi:transposase-like protein
LREVTEERDILARAVGFFGQRETMSAQRREFVEAEKQAGGNVAKASDLLDVSRSAFYQWRKQVSSARQVRDAELTGKIRQIHSVSGGTYGAPRIRDELRDQGWHVAKKRVLI